MRLEVHLSGMGMGRHGHVSSGMGMSAQARLPPKNCQAVNVWFIFRKSYFARDQCRNDVSNTRDITGVNMTCCGDV